MNAVPVIVLLAGVAAWLAVPHPAAALGRLRAATPRRVGRRLSREGAPAPSWRWLAGLGSTAVVQVLVPGIGGLIVGAAVGALVGIGLGFLAPRIDLLPLRVQLPDALDFLAVCLEAGQPVSRAVEAVAAISPPPTRRVLDGVGAQLALGRAGPLAWQELRGHRVWGRVAADIARAEHSGTGLAELLHQHARDARIDARDAAVKEARKVGVRSVIPLMACFLPAFILVGVVPIVAGLLHDFFG